MTKYFFSFIIVLLFGVKSNSQTYVTTDTSLQSQVNAAAPGSTFIIPDGTYADFYCRKAFHRLRWAAHH